MINKFRHMNHYFILFLGTIFGKEQSGAQDVGIDLQSYIIEEALIKLKSQ